MQPARVVLSCKVPFSGLIWIPPKLSACGGGGDGGGEKVVAAVTAVAVEKVAAAVEKVAAVVVVRAGVVMVEKVAEATVAVEKVTAAAEKVAAVVAVVMAVQVEAVEKMCTRKFFAISNSMRILACSHWLVRNTFYRDYDHLDVVPHK